MINNNTYKINIAILYLGKRFPNIVLKIPLHIETQFDILTIYKAFTKFNIQYKN